MGARYRLPMPRAGLSLLLSLLAVSLAPAILLTGCGESNEQNDGATSVDRIYRSHGISFRYPASWRPVESKGLSASTGKEIWTQMFTPASSSGADVVFVTEYRTAQAITKKNLRARAKNVTATVRSLTKKAGGSLLAGPSFLEMGGLPGYGFTISVPIDQNRDSTSRITLVWNSKTEYFVNCQQLVGGELGAEIERGCGMISDSFEVR